MTTNASPAHRLLMLTWLVLAACETTPSPPADARGADGAPQDVSKQPDAGAPEDASKPEDPGCPASCGAKISDDQRWTCSDLPRPCEYAGADPAVCILQALRDGKPGWYWWNIATSGFLASAHRELVVRPGRVALASFEVDYDLEVRRTSSVSRLQDPAFFTRCLTQAGTDLMDCLERAADQKCQ
jgi:hypothetical protein